MWVTAHNLPENHLKSRKVRLLSDRQHYNPAVDFNDQKSGHRGAGVMRYMPIKKNFDLIFNKADFTRHAEYPETRCLQ